MHRSISFSLPLLFAFSLCLCLIYFAFPCVCAIDSVRSPILFVHSFTMEKPNDETHAPIISMEIANVESDTRAGGGGADNELNVSSEVVPSPVPSVVDNTVDRPNIQTPPGTGPSAYLGVMTDEEILNADRPTSSADNSGDETAVATTSLSQHSTADVHAFDQISSPSNTPAVVDSPPHPPHYPYKSSERPPFPYTAFHPSPTSIDISVVGSQYQTEDYLQRHISYTPKRLPIDKSSFYRTIDNPSYNSFLPDPHRCSYNAFCVAHFTVPTRLDLPDFFFLPPGQCDFVDVQQNNMCGRAVHIACSLLVGCHSGSSDPHRPVRCWQHTDRAYCLNTGRHSSRGTDGWFGFVK